MIDEIHIDGSCNNRKTGYLARVGGCGVIQVGEKSVICDSFGPYKDNTSASMEVMGLLQALRMIEGNNRIVTIWCDNQYVVNAKEKNWLPGWIQDYRKHGFTRPNIELWDMIIDEIHKLLKVGVFIKLEWERGHAGNEWNELADKYADIGRKKGRTTKIIDR